jgi:Uncharacterized conserved protein (DUF2190)
MSDYLPRAFPGDLYTFKAGAAITGGQLLKLDTGTDMQVLIATTDADQIVGVASRDAASGANVAVYCRGVIHVLTAQGAVTRGDHVSAGSVAGTVHTSAVQTGAYVQVDANRTSRAEVGLALESIIDTGTGRVMFF